jgi:hypothetical protein
MTPEERAGLSISGSGKTDKGKTRPEFPNLFHLCQMLSPIGIALIISCYSCLIEYDLELCGWHPLS